MSDELSAAIMVMSGHSIISGKAPRVFTENSSPEEVSGPENVVIAWLNSFA